MNYLRFGAICELESAQALAPLCGHTETVVWRHCLRQKEVDLHTFRRRENCFKCVIIHERLKNMCTIRKGIDNVPKQCTELYTNNLYNGENEVGPDFIIQQNLKKKKNLEKSVQ